MKTPYRINTSSKEESTDYISLPRININIVVNLILSFHLTNHFEKVSLW